jgi:hypothetical protein
MKDLSEFNDVLSPNIQIEEQNVLEFEFDNFSLLREGHHWEILIEDAEEGETGIIVEREDFVNGKLEFDIDARPHELLLEDFDRIEKFAYEKGLIN